MLEQLKIIFEHGTLDVESTLRTIERFLSKKEMPLGDFSLGGRLVDIFGAQQFLRRSKRKTFNLLGKGFEFSLGSVLSYHLDFFEIKAASVPHIHWDEWAEEFLGHPNFVMAWVTNCDYDYWQNAEDPLLYSAVGRSYQHLPMKSNGLPYPVEQMIIDTSRNPGRWTFHDGYIEAIGSLMWLGESFWSLTGADLNRVKTTRWLDVSNVSPKVLRIQSAKRCFDAAEGIQSEVQRELRSLLFPPSPLKTYREQGSRS